MSKSLEENTTRLERAEHYIYTVGRIARTQQLETEPFLIVGIIAAIRRMLIITAESAGHANLTDPVFQAQMAELGLLALIIFLLAWAMKLLGQRSVDASS
jgi:hypothetical protein